LNITNKKRKGFALAFFGFNKPMMLREIFREIPIETISNTIEVCYSKQPSQNLKGFLKKKKNAKRLGV